MENIQNNVRKGTTTLGMVCADGVVLAADKRVTLGGHIVANKRFDKVFPVSDNIVITVAGSVSDAQLITKLLKSELKLRKIRTGKNTSLNETANLLGVIVYHNIRRMSTIIAITGFLVAGFDENGFHLFEIGVDGSVIESKDFVADGSGFMMAYGVLDTMYKPEIKVIEGTKLAVKAINAAMQRDTATGEGIDVYTVTKQGITKAFAKTINTHITA